MFYKITAGVVILIHFLWLGFVVLGFPVALYFNSAKWRLIHLAAVILMILMQVTRTICPLTYLEAWLKSGGSTESVYPGAFIIEWVERLIYVEDMTLEKIMYATMAYLVLILLSFWFRPLSRKKAPVTAV
ncbi:MAG: DUF2784 family protein [Candidatus Aminicenantes bacterium]|nr:DUF2784 family protein [Candidatus Aminicenantes bacterium]